MIVTTDEVRDKILVVEDSKDISDLLGEILQDAGYWVFYADNGYQALSQAEAVRPRLILLDLSLPELDGWEVIKQLRAKPEFAATLIIAVTAHTSTADRARTLAIGATSYVNKPFDIDMMLKQIAKLLGKGKSRE